MMDMEDIVGDEEEEGLGSQNSFIGPDLSETDWSEQGDRGVITEEVVGVNAMYLPWTRMPSMIKQRLFLRQKS